MKKVIKASKKWVITIVSFAIILVACIGATIGITMAYFGDVQSGTANITLGASIVMGSGGVVVTPSAETSVVPSQVVNCTVKATVKAGTSGNASTAVMQFIPTFTAGSTGATCTFTKGATYAVTGITGAVVIVSDDAKSLYLVDSTTTTNLKVITPTAAGVTIQFTIPITVPTTIGNTASGQACSLAIQTKALQSTIYSGSNAVSPTVANFKTYFDGFTAAA